MATVVDVRPPPPEPPAEPELTALPEVVGVAKLEVAPVVAVLPVAVPCAAVTTLSPEMEEPEAAEAVSPLAVAPEEAVVSRRRPLLRAGRREGEEEGGRGGEDYISPRAGESAFSHGMALPHPHYCAGCMKRISSESSPAPAHGQEGHQEDRDLHVHSSCAGGQGKRG